MPNNDKFQPKDDKLQSQEIVDGPVQATDDYDITPTVEGVMLYVLAHAIYHCEQELITSLTANTAMQEYLLNSILNTW